jgi:large subunit ribosomal protein L10
LAVSKEKKVKLVEQYVEQLKESDGVILADYRGLAVGDMNDLRNRMRPVDARLVVIKNRLLKLALAEAGLSVPEDWLVGPTAVSFCHGEIPPVAKALIDTAKEWDTVHIKGGLMGTSVMSEDQIRTLASLPPRDVLLSQVLGTMSAPATRAAGVVAAGIRQLLNVLQGYVDKLQESVPTPEPATEPA